jgi:hypothetical protein
MATPTPAIPTFTDGTLVHAVDLNALASNLTNLYNYNQARFNSQRPCVIASQTTGQSVPSPSVGNGTDTLINFQSALVNTDNMWTASVPNQVTTQHGGIYWVFGQIRYPSLGSSGFNQVYSGSILVNGTSFTNAVATNAIPAVTAGAGPGCTVGALVNLAAGATVFFNAWQSTGAAQTLPTNGGGTFLGAIFLTSST